MDWISLLSQIFEVCIIPLLGVLTAFVISLIKTKSAKIQSETKNELIKKYTELLTQTITDCVLATNQTYVDTLKTSGKFDLDAQRTAFDLTKDAVLKILTDEAKTYLTEAYGDLTIYIEQKIEAEVNIYKKSAVTE